MIEIYDEGYYRRREAEARTRAGAEASLIVRRMHESEAEQYAALARSAGPLPSGDGIGEERG